MLLHSFHARVPTQVQREQISYHFLDPEVQSADREALECADIEVGNAANISDVAGGQRRSRQQRRRRHQANQGRRKETLRNMQYESSWVVGERFRDAMELENSCRELHELEQRLDIPQGEQRGKEA